MFSSSFRFLLAAAVIAALAMQCGHRNPRFNQGFCSIGSEGFNYPMDAWIASFRKQADKVPVHDGKGNGTAPKSLLDGTCDMAPMTRPMSKAEIHSLVKKFGQAPVAVPVAVEALNIIVPVKSPVREISMDQIKKLFHGGPARLKDALPVTGSAAEAPPELFGLNSAMDRFRWFRTLALNEAPFSERVLETSGPLKLVDRVAKSKAGFGYARFAETTPGVRALNIRVKDGLRRPAGKTVSYEQYPLARFYYIYLPSPGAQKAHPELAKFMRYILSKEGQAALTPLGLYPLSERHRLKSLALIR